MASNSQCITPYMLSEKNGGFNVPCGKCYNCLRRRASAWSFRLMQQNKIAVTSHFITLTYDTSSVHITQAGFMGLNKRDLQLFFKRLRKAHGQVHNLYTIKYYAVGEYGSTTKRPHYHIILFNAKLELIQPAWQLGSVHYGTLTEASVGYTLKYISKPKTVPMHRNDDRQPEFSLMSKGLGINYLTEQMIEWHKKDLNERMYCVIEDGKKISMPRYFKNKIYSDEQRKQVGSIKAMQMVEEKWKEITQKGYGMYKQKEESRRQGIIRKQQYENSQKSNSKI